MHRIRLAVRENRLTSTVIAERDYVPAIEDTGRGWVAEADGAVVGFAIDNRITGCSSACWRAARHTTNFVARLRDDRAPRAHSRVHPYLPGLWIRGH